MRCVLLGCCIVWGALCGPASAAILEFGGAQWNAGVNYNRMLLPGSQDAAWTSYDNDATNQQYLWLDISAALDAIPTGHEVLGATLSFSGVRALGAGAATVQFSAYEVVGANKGMAEILNVDENPGNNGGEIVAYANAHTGYGSLSGVTTSFTPRSLDITGLVQGWEDGSLTANVGQMMILHRSTGSDAAMWIRWAGVDVENAIPPGNMPVLRLLTADPNSDFKTLGNTPQMVANPRLSDNGRGAAFIDLTNPQLLSAGYYDVTNTTFGVTTANADATVIPFLAVLTGASQYEVIWAGGPLDGAALGELGVHSINLDGQFTLAADATVYAGMWWHSDALNSPIGYVEGVGGLAFVNDNLPASEFAELGHIYGAIGASLTLGRWYDFNITVQSVPEPSAWAMAGVALAGCAPWGWRRLRRK